MTLMPGCQCLLTARTVQVQRSSNSCTGPEAIVFAIDAGCHERAHIVNFVGLVAPGKDISTYLGQKARRPPNLWTVDDTNKYTLLDGSTTLMRSTRESRGDRAFWTRIQAAKTAMGVCRNPISTLTPDPSHSTLTTRP